MYHCSFECAFVIVGAFLVVEGGESGKAGAIALPTGEFAFSVDAKVVGRRAQF